MSYVIACLRCDTFIVETKGVFSMANSEAVLTKAQRTAARASAGVIADAVGTFKDTVRDEFTPAWTSFKVAARELKLKGKERKTFLQDSRMEFNAEMREIVRFAVKTETLKVTLSQVWREVMGSEAPAAPGGNGGRKKKLAVDVVATAQDIIKGLVKEKVTKAEQLGIAEIMVGLLR